jgi:hypothetical protein
MDEITDLLEAVAAKGDPAQGQSAPYNSSSTNSA